MAAMQGKNGIALGNAVGSIICDTGLILGLAILIAALDFWDERPSQRSPDEKDRNPQLPQHVCMMMNINKHLGNAATA